MTMLTPIDHSATAIAAPDRSEALADRLFESLIGGMELLTIDVGLSTGLYAALRDNELAAAELAARAGLDTRYVFEWVEQQAAAGLIDVDNPAASRGQRRYRLGADHAKVLLEPDSPFHLAPAGPLMVGLGRTTPAVRDAFATGAGVPYAAYGAEVRDGIAGLNRPMVVGELAESWLPAMGTFHDELSHADQVRILDIGCGLGWTSIALARALSHAVVHGVDLDAASVSLARENAVSAGVADRVMFTVADAGTLDPDAGYDLVTAFETLHDMADPVAALRMAREALRDGGRILIADEHVAETFDGPADPFERLLHAFSVLHCLPATRAEEGPVAHGTMARPTDVLGWIKAAGYVESTILDVDNDMWRFYLARR